MPQPFNVRSQDRPGTDLGSWDASGNITIPGTLTAANVVNGSGGGSSVASVTALDSTVTVAGTTAVTVGVNVIPESKVTNLVTDLGLKAPLASPTFTGTVTTASATLSGAVVETPVALTDVATIVVDASLGNVFTVTLGGNRTLGAPSNPSNGQKILFRVRQDATGSRTLAYNAVYRFSTDIPSPTLTTAINKTDYLGFIYTSADTKWDCIGVVKGF